MRKTFSSSFAFALVFALVVLCGLAPSQARGRGRIKDRQNLDHLHRKGKLFSLFNTVVFKNEVCTSSASTSNGHRNGTCYTSAECQSRGGRAMGSCAAGFGVCCLFLRTSANGDIRENCSYIQNPGFPGMLMATNSLSYTVRKCSDEVCRLRLDFESFSLRGIGGTDINNEGVCLDMFTVTTSTNQRIPTICGNNDGQHIYVDIGASSGDSSTINFNFNGDASRMWDIKVTQLECGHPLSPPDGCLQFLIGHTGRFTTFNFSPTADNHLNDQQYSICIRGEEGFCCVQYQVCADEMSAFSLNPTLAASKSQVDTLCLTTDFITISESSQLPCQQGNNNHQTHNLYCGKFLNPIPAQVKNVAICDCTAPFVVDIFTDGDADPGGAGPNVKHSRGLCLDYMQIPCTN